MQTSLQAEVAVVELAGVEPCILAKEGFGGKDTETFLVAKRQVLCTIPADQAPPYLLEVYYVFNIAYPKGLVSHFILFENMLLSKGLRDASLSEKLHHLTNKKV